MHPFRLLAPLLLLAACSPGGEPEPEGAALSFRAQSGPLAWSLDEPTRELRLGNPDGGAPALVLSCDGVRTGLFPIEPTITPLEVTAGAVRMEGPGRPLQRDGEAYLDLRNGVPNGWSDALATAAVLKLQYGDQGLQVQGPGPELAGNFLQTCAVQD